MKNKQILFLKIHQINCYLKVFFLILIGIFFFSFANAYEIKDTTTEIKGDFVLEPAKVEVSLDPGSFRTEVLNILNRTDKELNFKIEIEDFMGSQDPNQTVILKGEEKGPYSLKDYLVPEVSSFTLKPGQKMILPVVLAIPTDAESGGLYGSVLISSQSTVQSQVGATVVSRLGALFFVNIKGQVTRDGELTSFFEKIDSEDGQISFDLLFTNRGNVHLDPYGYLRVFNLVGTKVGEIEIKPFFAMPDSVRYRNIVWDKGNLFGRYKAVISLNRGYDDKVDEMTVIFWVVPIKMIVSILGGIILLILIIIWLIRTFDFSISRDKKEDKTESNSGQKSNPEGGINNSQNNSQNQNNPPINNNML